MALIALIALMALMALMAPSTTRAWRPPAGAAAWPWSAAYFDAAGAAAGLSKLTDGGTLMVASLVTVKPGLTP